MTTTDTPDTRERLLQTAGNLMWERSFQATGVDELCKQANAKKGSFYHYFSSKSDLAIAAIEQSWAETREAVFEPVFSGDDSGLDQLRNLGQRIYHFQRQLAEDRGSVLGCPFGSLGQEMARQDEQLRESLQRIFDAHCDYFEQALNRAQAADEIPAGDNRQRAINLFAFMEGALLLAKVANNPELLRDTASAIPTLAAAWTGHSA